MKKKGLLIGCLLSLGLSAEASIQNARNIYQARDKSRYLQLSQELVREGYYFSTVPFLKEYLAISGRTNSAALDSTLDEVIAKVGVKQFEALPKDILEKSNSPMIRYILARKEFRSKKYDQALKHLGNRIPENHVIKPFAFLLEGSALSLLRQHDKAIFAYKSCIDSASRQLSNEKDKDRIRQLQITRDYCTVGIPRSQFEANQFDLANSSYLDLAKASYIWPEILYEEAWNSFYLKDYNRTLGKLVTYKAPVFNYIFNPDIDVLKALTYMEMCLWEDSNKEVESFYTNYEQDYTRFKKLLSTLGKDYRQLYLLVKDRSEGKLTDSKIMNSALATIQRDPAYLELYNAFNSGRDEVEKLRHLPADAFRSALNQNLKEALSMQRNLIGSYTRSQLQIYSGQMAAAFEGMSNIKLEVISKRKTELYEDVSMRTEGRERGDIAHLKRTDKQYFWNFNGEFWADELGDYVFSLKSECR